MQFGEEPLSLGRLQATVDAAQRLRIRGRLGQRPFRLPDALARRADGAREHDRALGRDGAGHDGLARRPAGPGSAGQGAGRDRRPLRGTSGRRARAWLLRTRLRRARHPVRGALEAIRRGDRVLRALLEGQPAPRSALLPRALRPRARAGPRTGGIPLWIGSWGSKPGLRRVARAGDGWLASAYNTTPERFSAARAALARALEDRGRDATAFPTRSPRCGPGCRRIARRAIACLPTSSRRS